MVSPLGVAEGGRDPSEWVRRSRSATTLAGRGYRLAREVDIGTHTLALAAQQVFCTAPLVVALAAVVQRFAGQDVTTLLARYLGLQGPAVREVTSMFTPKAPVTTTGLVIGLAVVAVFSTGVAATQQRSYELSWGLARARGLREIARRAWWLLALLVYVVVLLYSGQVVHLAVASRPLGVVVRVVVQLLASVLFFWWSQHTLLGGRVSWRALRPGALAIATGTTVLVLVSSWVLPGQITSEVEEYGTIGAPFVLSLWLLVYSGIITGGALLGAVVYQHNTAHHGSAPPVHADRA